MTATQEALKKLDEQIAILQKLRDFAANPIAFEAMLQLAHNGHTVDQAPLKENSKSAEAPVEPIQRRRRANSLRSDILAACRTFKDSHFIVKTVIDAMVSDRYQFNAKDVRSAVSSNLQVLAQQGEIALFKRGIGSEPSVYANHDSKNLFAGQFFGAEKTISE